MVMLFRPKFCANCGEKIERTEWGVWTSGRFCETCAIEFKGQELIPRVAAGAALLIGVLGVGSYLKSGETVVTREPQKLVEKAPTTTNETAQPVQAPLEPVVKADPTIAKPANTAPPPRVTKPTVAAEAVYYCGAPTKKGTPCSRRVKGNVRCFQHAGMPVVADDKLGN